MAGYTIYPTKAESSSVSNIDKDIATTQASIKELTEKLRITKQSLANIDPKYQANQAYISKLKEQEKVYTAQLDSLNSTLASQQKQKQDASTDNKISTPGDIRKFENQQAENKANDEATANETPPEAVDTVARPNTNRTYNPLSAFSSYTYKLSLYLMTPEAVNSYATDGIYHTSQMLLIAQSGGINKDTKIDSPRADGFELDIGIDNLELVTQVNSKSSNYSGNTTEYSFTIYEPYGMTFPSKLVRAVRKMQEKTTMKRSIAHPMEALSEKFLLVIRFFGYDEKGELMSATTGSKTPLNKTDDPAAFERAFPIKIVEMNTRLENKVATYNVKAVAAGIEVGLGSVTGSVSEQIAISGATVGDILSKGATSLTGIFNAKEAEKVKKGSQEFADEIAIKFEDFSEIEAATIVDKNQYSPAQTAYVGVPNALQVNVRTAQGGKGSTVATLKREIQVPANSRIVQVIENVISQSSYISDCLKTMNKETTQTVIENDKNYSENSNPKVLTWFNITPSSEIIDYDTKRKTYAYRVTYYVTKYEVPYIRAAGVQNQSIYPGPSKIYNYWYTGKNDGIISYTMKYNNLYQNINSLYGQAPVFGNDNDPAPNRSMASAGGDTTGKVPGTSEELSTLKTWLYSSKDQLHANLTILGDPDFLMTAPSGSFKMITSLDKTEDAPINPGLGQVFIEIDFNQVSDYDSSTGLLTPDDDIIFWNYSDDLKRRTEGRMIYMVTTVKSKFSKGVFTQEMQDMSLPPFLNAGGGAPARETAQDTKQDTKRKTLPDGNKARADFAKTDPRRVDKGVTEDDNPWVDPEEYAFQNATKNKQKDTSREPPTFRGRGATRTYDNTNKTRTVGK